MTRAADEPKPNILTPKEIADGWILLFDGETTFGWKIDGEAKVADGALVVGGDKSDRLMSFATTFGLVAEYRLEHTDLQGRGEAQGLLLRRGRGGGTTSGACVIRPATGRPEGLARHVPARCNGGDLSALRTDNPRQCARGRAGFPSAISN